MAVPKCKVSKARRDSRRSNNTKLTAVGLEKCGFYDGKQVLNVKKDA